MEKDILKELEKMMEERHIKVPALSKQVGIPKDRIYKWYQQGTKVKVADATKIWDWINGKKDDNNFSLSEDAADYKTKYIELLERTLAEKEQRIKELEGQLPNPNGDTRKKASG